MELGKHVYVEKPLTWSVQEARVLRDTARRMKVVTQMGNQGHSSHDARLINEWVQGGKIGPVYECTSGRIVRSGPRAFRGRRRPPR